MQAIVVDSYGGPDVLRLVERPTPEPAAGQVRVAVAAAAVNPVDAAVRQGFFAAVTDAHLPVGLGWDVAGVVDAVGDGVTAVTVGTRVAALLDTLVAPTAGYATHAVVPVDALAPVPDGLDLVPAATLPLNALTADQALDLLDLEAGRTLLVTGAAGAVGDHAVRLAARRGIGVVGLARPGDEADVTASGATKFVSDVRDVHDVDGVLDTAGLGGPALAAARDGGVFVALTDPGTPAAERGIRVATVHVHHDGRRLGELFGAAADGALRLRVAGTYPLTGVGQAQERVAAGGVRGRLVLVP